MENPYWLSLVSPEPTYWRRIIIFAGLFFGFFKVVDGLVRRAAADPSRSKALAALATTDGPGCGLAAATCACSSLHAVVTASAAVWSVAVLGLSGDPDGSVARLWSWTLAFSQGYFFADGVLFGLSPHGETWVAVHHVWMTVAHNPIGELSRGCALMGCGLCSRAVWLSAVGYLAEISTLFLNIRWFQHRWMTKHSTWYTLNSICLLVTYPLTRIVLVIVLLGTSLWPFWSQYRENGISSLVVFTTATYAALMLMSVLLFHTDQAWLQTSDLLRARTSRES